MSLSNLCLRVSLHVRARARLGIDLNQLIKAEGSGDASTSPQWKEGFFSLSLYF